MKVCREIPEIGEFFPSLAQTISSPNLYVCKEETCCSKSNYFCRHVQEANEKTLGSFKSSESSRHSKLEQLISGHVQVQNDFCSQSRAKIDTHAERRADERSQLTAAYADTVAKLIQTMGDIERVTSEHMYSEQSWVEQLLKRVRNEADSATNDFHAYLVDQLLTVSTKILAALQQQDKSVQDLSTKMDKNFAGLTQKLETYLAEQGSVRQKKIQAETEFFSGLERRNAALTSAFEDDAQATEEYIKKSNAFNAQMMSLIKAKAKEEEAFLASRNASMTQAMKVTSATSEATASAQAESKELVATLANLETNYKVKHFRISEITGSNLKSHHNCEINSKALILFAGRSR